MSNAMASKRKTKRNEEYLSRLRALLNPIHSCYHRKMSEDVSSVNNYIFLCLTNMLETPQKIDTLITKISGATNFRSQACPKICSAENILFFAVTESL